MTGFNTWAWITIRGVKYYNRSNVCFRFSRGSVTYMEIEIKDGETHVITYEGTTDDEIEQILNQIGFKK